LPTVGEYAGWFTTVGPGHPTNYYFANTSWSSNGDVLAMNTYYPNQGIWFGRTSGYSDPSNFSLANTTDGNVVSLRFALSGGATDWSLYWYDADGYASGFSFKSDGIAYSYRDQSTGDPVEAFLPVADMTQFQTVTSYILAGQVSYFANGSYLGGGQAGSGTGNFLLVGDGSAATYSGTGSMYIDYLTIETAPLSVPSPVPEPSHLALMLGLGVAGGLLRKRQQG
jgi:hypothetical protein